ncbi:hypothetical protein [Candidatus Coxiella mudrowiae]|uniref:hypothetical protein n=1 Tax=Candidatus Coxiella mudrowiae TaxID=2054173 RepID=UPI001FD03942|nr:hypothetical protein [Candidatus Coxiella mudrowiae]
MVVNLLFRVMDDKVLEQITNMAQLPELVNAAMANAGRAYCGYSFLCLGDVTSFDL